MSPNILKHGNGLEQVLEEYKEHAFRILFKAPKDAEGCAKLTTAQSKGFAYYRSAIQTLQALIEAPKPEWVDVQFKRSRTL
jgi:hypothetical protein